MIYNDKKLNETLNQYIGLMREHDFKITKDLDEISPEDIFSVVPLDDDENGIKLVFLNTNPIDKFNVMMKEYVENKGFENFEE